MKYLRRITESLLGDMEDGEKKFKDIQLDMKDILLDISDIGYEIEIFDKTFSSYHRNTSFHIVEAD